jgi:hypothetical protein
MGIEKRIKINNLNCTPYSTYNLKYKQDPLFNIGGFFLKNFLGNFDFKSLGLNNWMILR